MLQAVFNDARRTGIGAFVLLVLAVLFVDPSGVGGGAVADADAARAASRSHGPAEMAAAGTVRTATASGRATQSNWAAVSEDQADDSAPEGTPKAAEAPALPSAPAFEIRPPEPQGADFPPALRRRN